MILEAVLGNHASWRTASPLLAPPEILEQLNWGTAHTAYKVRAETAEGPADFVVRFLPRVEASLALDFSSEIALMARAAARGLAPEVVFVQPENRLLVTPFIDGTTDISAKSLGNLIAAIHALPCEHAPIQLIERLNAYTDSALARAVPSEQLIDPEFAPLTRAIAQLEAHAPVTCHNDLGAGNVIESEGRAIAIDWEYGACGSPYFDLAAASAGWPELDEGLLINSVFPRNFSPRLWQLAKAVYAAIEWNWYQASGARRPARVTRERVANLLTALT